MRGGTIMAPSPTTKAPGRKPEARVWSRLEARPGKDYPSPRRPVTTTLPSSSSSRTIQLLVLPQSVQ